MSQLVEDDECEACMKYVAFVSDPSEWTCCVCQLKETPLFVEESYHASWGRYRLLCRHSAHIRCYKRLCKQIGYVGCPACGSKIAQIPENEYCERCHVFGHPSCY